jgi:MFS family permease
VTEYQKEYPSWKVLIGFALCPSLAAASLVLFGFLWDVYAELNGHSFTIYLATVFLFSVTAMYLYGIPAVLLAILYAMINLRKSLASYVFVFICGGIGAFFWTIIVNYLSTDNTYHPDHGHGASFPYLKLGNYELFFLGAISSVVMACVVLPESVDKKINK